MKNRTLTNQVSLIMDKLDEFPIDMVEIEIIQPLFSSQYFHHHINKTRFHYFLQMSLDP